MIYFAFVHSQLLYGIEVYANTTTNHFSNTFMQKYIHHRLKLPSIFCEYFDQIKQIHQHDTRQKEYRHCEV